MDQATGIYVIIIVVAGTMFNIILLALALRIICRRYASVHHSDLSSSGQLRARGDVESPQLKQPNATVVVQPDDQVEVALKLTVEPLQYEGAEMDAAHEYAEEQRHCWVVSVPLERRSKSVV
ncbi:g11536 [Coccomyxa viridis]|uniref:G11536 protein n=1 Tax=Coccomyxa viridis TaxID=1274662 RepID=A0ABP1GAU0_9CHLO